MDQELTAHAGKIVADRNKCRGYGNCVATDPSHFDLDDDGKVVVLDERFTNGERELVERAVNSCPVSALRIEAG